MSAASIVTTLMRQVEEKTAEIGWLRDWVRFLLVTYVPPNLFEALDGEEILDIVQLGKGRPCRRR